MKKLFAALFAGAMILTACGSSAPDMNGTWKTEAMDEFDGAHFEANIKDNSVTVQLTDGTTGITYWEGSFSDPEQDGETYTWTSIVDEGLNDTQKTFMGDEQEFEYDGETLTCKLNISGISTNLNMAKE